MPVPPPSDETRRADAMAPLARIRERPPERLSDLPAGGRRGAFAGAALSALAVAALALSLLAGSPTAPVPRWQSVLGVVVMVAGLVFQVAGLVVVVRVSGRLREASGPIAALSRPHRRRLRAAVRGRVPVSAGDLPLARSLAGTLVLQAVTPATTAGLGIFWLGRWVGRRDLVAALLSGCYAVAVAALWTHALWDARRVERFLASHPDDER